MDTQIIFNAANVFLTSAMSIATVWLAIETRRMATVAKASIDLESRPYLAFSGIDLKFANATNSENLEQVNLLRTALRLGNPGKILVNYHVNSITCTHSFQSGDMSLFATTGGVIFPGGETLFVLPFEPLLTKSDFAPAGEIHFSITFWSIANESQNLKAKIQFNVTSMNPPDWQWIFLDGPSYCEVEPS